MFGLEAGISTGILCVFFFLTVLVAFEALWAWFTTNVWAFLYTRAPLFYICFFGMKERNDLPLQEFMLLIQLFAQSAATGGAG